MSGSTETWYAVYVTQTGALFSVGTAIADEATLSARGLTSLQLAGDPSGQVWNPSTLTFGAAPPPAITLTAWQFIQLFTPTEFAAIRASTDATVGQIILMLQTASSVNLSDPTVVNGAKYIAGIGLIAQGRVAQILAGQAPS